jgi:TP901 family phage tail tape measure protein
VAEIIKTVIDVDINTSGAAAELRSLQQQINAFNLTLNKGQLEQGQASRVFAEGLRNSINTGGFFRAELVKMQTAAGALDSTLRKGQGTLGQFFSASFNKKGGMAAEVFALAAERARTMQTQFIATAKASKGMQEALSVRPLTAFSADAAVSAQRMQILNSMFKQGTTGLINFGKNVQWTGRQLMVGFTIPLTIFGTTAGRVFSDLEKQAVNFKKVYGDIFTTPAELEENFKAVQGLSREFTKYGIAAKDTLGLAAQAAAAGRKNTELTDAVRESTRLATLGQMDQNAALETTISLQSAFRLSGQELADTINFLNMVENQTVVSLQDIAAAIPRVAPVIKGLGGDVKDLTVFLAAMQEGGVSAEQGANALKSGLGSLINPTKAATDVLAGFKINLDSIIQTNRGDLMGTVTAFSDALSTLDEFSRQQALESLFGKFQYARLGALFENISREGSQAQQVISTLGYSTEQLAKSAEKELTTVEQAFSTQLTGAIERLKIAIAPLGEIFVKMAIPLVNMATKIFEAFNKLPEGVKNVVALATALGGVLLPAATMIFGLFANLIGTFAKFTHSMGMFGVTLLRKGPLAAIKSLTQSANYLSLSEIDAANAARQLGSATELANAALLSQVGSANSADIAIKTLTNSYRVLISEQTRASQVQPFLFGTGQAASSRVGGSAAASVATTMATRGKSRIKAVGLNQGGSVFTPDNSSTVPGVGNTDKVPAMLTPGEFVVNKESTKNNLGLLHSINAQRLNVGGKVKNGIQYAMSGFLIGNTPGYSAATNAVAAKLVGRSQVAKTVGAKASNKVEQLKNNLVYLLTKSNNQQLTGVRTMKEFDKRGVPLDVLKQDMVSEEGLWMIDAFAKGDWKKDAYKATLENNFANIASKYPGKEIRFLDSAGLERVQPLLGKPEYENVQFVSVKELQNKELFDNLTPEHLETLMTDGTQVSKELKYSKSRGTTTLKDVYRGIPGMESYTRIQKNWRGTPKPKNRQGAHMYNMGGKVDGVQYAMAGQLIKKGTKKFKTGKVKHVRKNLKARDKEILQDMVNNVTWEKRVQGARLNDGISLYNQGYSLEEIDNILIEIGYFKKGLTDLAPMSDAVKKFAKPEKIKSSQIKNKLRQAAPTEESRKAVSEYFLKKGYIDEELANLINGPTMGAGVRSHYAEDAIANAKKSSISFPGYLGQAIIEPSKYNSVYNQIGVSGSPKNKADHDKLMGYVQELLGIDKRLIKADFDVFSMMNKGGQVPGMQYANTGKIIAAMFKSKGRNELIDRLSLSNLPSDVKNKIINGEIKKRGDFTLRADRSLFDNSISRTISSNPSKDDLLDLLTTDYNNLYSNSHLYSIALNKNADNDVLNVLATQYRNRLRYAKPEEVGTHLNQTAKIIQDKGIKLNKGGMIPGVQYANKGKQIQEVMSKVFGINADEIAPMFGALPQLRTQFLNRPKPFKKISEYVKDKSFIDNDIYFIHPRGGEPHEARIFMGTDGQLRKQRIGYEPHADSMKDPNFRHGGDPRRYKEEILDPNFEAAIYNKNEYKNQGAETLRPKKFNKGGMIPGVQYLNLGGIGSAVKRSLDTPSRRSRQVLRSLLKDSDEIAKSKGSKGIFDDVKKSKQNFLDTPLSAATHAVGQAYANQVMPVYQSLLQKGIIKPGQFNSFDDFMNFLSKKSLGNRSTSGQKQDPLISKFNEEFMKINHGLGPDDTLRFYRNSRPGGRQAEGSNPKVGYYSLDREMGWGYGLASDISIGGGKRYQIDLRPGDIPGPIMSGGYADEFAINLDAILANKAKEVGEMLPNVSKRLTGQQGMTRFFNDKKFYKDNDLSTMKFNKGNIVPGVGNTDTVPAMLTPGEFVINKESTKKNYDLLTAINNGKVDGYNKGGGVANPMRMFYGNYTKEEIKARAKSIKKAGGVGTLPKGIGAVGMGAGLAASFLPSMFMSEETSMKASMAASIAGYAVASKAATIGMLALSKQTITAAKVFPQLSKGIPALTSALNISAATLFGVIGPIALLSIGIIALNKMANNAVQSGGELIKSMYGSSDRMKEFAKAFGRENTQQTLARQRAELAAGAPIGQEAQQYSTQFLESKAGATLLKDLQNVSKVSGTAGRDQALLSQLTRGIVTGSITAEEARAIALDVGKKLGDQSIGIKLGAQISDLVGPDGKKLTDNILKINAVITPTIDMNEIGKNVSKQWENLGIGSKLGMILTGKGTDDMIVDALAQAAIEANAITSEQLDLLRLELESGNISIQEFTSKKDAITAQSNKTTLDAIETINKKYGEGTDKALNALREFRKEFEKEFKTKISVLSDEDEKNAQKAQDILRKGEAASTNPLPLGQQVVANVATKTTDEEKRKYLTELGLDPSMAVLDPQQMLTAIEQTFTADQKLAKIVSEKLFGPQAKQELGTKAADALALLDPQFNAEIGKLLDEDKTGQLKEKLVNLFEVDPETFAKFQNLFDVGGPDALTKALTMGEDELSKYLDNVSKLSALPKELGIDTTKLISDPEKLDAFVKNIDMATKSLDLLKEGAKKGNITQKYVLETAFAGNQEAQNLLNYYLKTKKFKDIDLNMVLGASMNPEIAKALVIMKKLEEGEGANVSLAEAVWASNTLSNAQVAPGGGKSDNPYVDDGSGTKSALQTAKDAARQTKEVIASQSKLLAAGISVEALEGLSPEAIIELGKQSGKQLRDNIKLFNDQAESIRINKLVLQQLALEENPIKKALEDSKKTVEGYDDQIKELNKTIEKTNRANELDRRRIEDKNKALENLTKKEKNVNDQYNERIKALDKVANANDRVAERQRQQIDLATALTSGDIAGAAQAAAAMTQTGAQNQIEDTKTALEAQRQAELDGLTESVNGRLMSRKDIQAEIDAIEETIYQRNINLRFENDEIYKIQEKINQEKVRQQELNDVLAEQDRAEAKLATNKLTNAKNITAETKKQRDNAIAAAYADYKKLVDPRGTNKNLTLSNYKTDILGLAFGGMIKKYAFGGNVGYKGSREAPPRLKMARGSLVPGLGNTDRVPALLTPGEFVVRKSVAQANMPLLKALNSDVFPSMSLNTPDVAPTVTSSTSTILNNTPVYNYSISVNVPNTTASPDEIANVVVSRIKRSMDTNIRSNRY